MSAGDAAGAKKRPRRIALLLCLLLLIGGGLWYARPVGLDTLYPGMEPEIFDISISRFYKVWDNQPRNLRIAAGEPGFDELLSEWKALRFRRPLTNLVLQAIPPLANGPSRSLPLEEGMVHTLYILGIVHADSGEWNAAGLFFWIDEWSYTGNTLWGEAVHLPLKLSHDREVGQALGEKLWEASAPFESKL